MAMADHALLARLLTAEAAMVCRPFAGAVAVAVAGAAPVSVAIPRAHLGRLGGVPLLELVRVASSVAVEIGDAEGFAPGDLAAAAPTVLLVAARSRPLAIAQALWACRMAGATALVVAGPAMRTLALLDGGADLVVDDVGAHVGGGAHVRGPSTGVIAGSAALVAACAALAAASLFRANASETEATLAAFRARAVDPAAAEAMPLAG